MARTKFGETVNAMFPNVPESENYLAYQWTLCDGRVHVTRGKEVHCIGAALMVKVVCGKKNFNDDIIVRTSMDNGKVVDVVLAGELYKPKNKMFNGLKDNPDKELEAAFATVDKKARRSKLIGSIKYNYGL